MTAPAVNVQIDKTGSHVIYHPHQLLQNPEINIPFFYTQNYPILNDNGAVPDVAVGGNDGPFMIFSLILLFCFFDIK
jgi:hypothetical protein